MESPVVNIVLTVDVSSDIPRLIRLEAQEQYIKILRGVREVDDDYLINIPTFFYAAPSSGVKTVIPLLQD